MKHIVTRRAHKKKIIRFNEICLRAGSVNRQTTHTVQPLIAENVSNRKGGIKNWMAYAECGEEIKTRQDNFGGRDDEFVKSIEKFTVKYDWVFFDEIASERVWAFVCFGSIFIGCLSDQNSATPVALLNRKGHNYTMIYVIHDDTKWMASDVWSVAYADAKPSSFTSFVRLTRWHDAKRMPWVEPTTVCDASAFAAHTISKCCAFNCAFLSFFRVDRRQSVFVLSVETSIFHVPR